MKKLIFSFILIVSIAGCKKEGGTPINIFTIQDDITLGQQLVEELESDSSDFVILQPADYPVAYEHLQRIVDDILAGGEVKYEKEFEWRTRIIHNDSVLNAFCALGGYMYVFTGLIHYLDSEDQLAGVMGHEIAHADRRHSTQQLTKMFGINILISATLGDENALASVAAGLLMLSYSRENETDADLHSVKYLCPTDYNAAGGAGFFEKIEADGGSIVPEFLSTHPSPDKRIDTFYDKKEELKCEGTEIYDQRYQDFKNSLP